MSDELIVRLLADLHDRVRPTYQRPKGPLPKFTSPLDSVTVRDEVTHTKATLPHNWNERTWNGAFWA